MMPPLRFINLDRDAQRRARMESELARSGVTGDRYPAVLWTALEPARQQALYSERLNRRQFHQPLVAGEKGCYASHLALWRTLVESDVNAMVVLEDDVRLLPGFGEVCRAVAALPEGSWDMVKLIGRGGLGKTEKVRRRQPLCDGFERVDYRRVPSLTAGYLISRQGADKLLRTRIPFGRPIDVDLRHWWECDGLRVQGVSPAVIALDDTSELSSIGPKQEGPGFQHQWRKFRHKLMYSLANAWHSTT